MMRAVTGWISIIAVALSSGAPLQAETDRPGWIGLGFTYQAATDGKPGFLHVRHVLAGSPAALAGLKPQDSIVAINGKAPRYKDTLEAIRSFASLKPGAQLTFDVIRAGRKQRIKVTAAVMPEAYYELWKNNEAAASAKGKPSSSKPPG